MRWNWSSRSERAGADIAEVNALTHVWGYAAGLDMTRRDLQNAAKQEGKPWDMGKGFDHLGADWPDGAGGERSAIPRLV